MPFCSLFCAIWKICLRKSFFLLLQHTADHPNRSNSHTVETKLHTTLTFLLDAKARLPFCTYRQKFHHYVSFTEMMSFEQCEYDSLLSGLSEKWQCYSPTIEMLWASSLWEAKMFHVVKSKIKYTLCFSILDGRLSFVLVLRRTLNSSFIVLD